MIAKQVCLILVLLILFTLQSCTQTHVKSYHPPYDEQQLSDILLYLKEQDIAAHSYYAIGHIKVQRPGPDFEANALIIASRDPLRIKLEITHFWGRPLFYFLIDNNKIHILSFPEKRYYLDDIHESTPSDLMPIHLDANLFWAIGRGFPILYPYDRAVSNKGERISLLNELDHSIQNIEFHPGVNRPFKVSFPGKGLLISFSNYMKDDIIQYARKVKICDQETNSSVELNIKRIVFNKTFDSALFELVPPEDFELFQRQPHP